MSNSMAIAAVTATLQKLLKQGFDADPDLQGADVTMQPPDKARGNGATSNQLNLFLYHTELDAAWRNQDMPGRVKPGETGYPPLPLNLFYLLTAYAGNDDKAAPLSHLLLGAAMRILHDHPVLGAQEIRQALDGNNFQGRVDLQDQIERVRIVPQPLTLDEMSKLWTTFQTQYRISAAYQVAVVLIESTRPAKTPLPVVGRGGQQDSGVSSQPDLTPPFPTLTKVSLPPEEGQRSSFLPGDTLILDGFHLNGDKVVASLSNPRLDTPNTVDLGAQTEATRLQLKLPDAPTKWVAGFYTLAVTTTVGDQTRATNQLSIALAPQITSALPLTVARDNAGDATIELTCKPRVRPDQRVALLLGDREITAEAHPTQTQTLRFVVRAAPVGTFALRLRVDGVDSLLIDYKAKPPAFKASDQVTIQ